ncbi:CLUMA_CG004413, isoform A [Clunio marinus]|uniref:CLUMA_CG004413, isoform A n=1 Tax=Clunio marinus TaxID=568069 RepID=A0A1J1HRL4_9DIPT|nr:CLUMA_CG004413, isoform A [Clunio marinus]
MKQSSTLVFEIKALNPSLTIFIPHAMLMSSNFAIKVLHKRIVVNNEIPQATSRFIFCLPGVSEQGQLSLMRKANKANKKVKLFTIYAKEFNSDVAVTTSNC